MLRIDINTEVGEARLKRMPDAVRDALKEKELHLAHILVAKAQGAAPRLTGKLAASIKESVRASEKSVTARVYVSGKARKYAHAQEFGAKTRAHEIFASKAAALAFVFGGEPVFAKSVMNPGAVIPAHPFLTSSFKSMQAEIRSGLIDAVRLGLSGGDARPSGG